MDSEKPMTGLSRLEAAELTPIAELGPDLSDPRTKAVRGVVTITWPYNSVKKTFAFNLAEPDFRLRRNKGQVRIEFTGKAAKAAASCGLGSNDEILLGLDGAAWEAAATNKRLSLPGADLEWKLVFTEKLSLKAVRAESNETVVVSVDEQSFVEPDAAPPVSIPTEPLTATESPSPPAPVPLVSFASPVRETRKSEFRDGEFASPAFIKRARMSYGSLFEGDLDIFEEDGGIKGVGRKRSRFGRDSSAWRYASQSPSPEPAASPSIADARVTSPAAVEMTDEGCQTMELDQSSPQTQDIPAESRKPEAAASPSIADERLSSPAMVEMADEGCQTTELDQLPPQTQETSVETRKDAMPPTELTMNDAPADEQVKSALEHQKQAPHLDNTSSSTTAPPSTTVRTEKPPAFSDIFQPEFTAPTHSDQRPSFRRDNLKGSPWNADMTSSAIEVQPQEPLSHLHGEDFLSPSGFDNLQSATKPIPFDESDEFDESHANDAGNIGTMHDSMTHPPESASRAVDFAPPNITEDTHTHPVHDEALTDYPASYLENDGTSQHGQVVGQEVTHYPTTVELGPSSWATVNPRSQVTAEPPMNPPGSIHKDERDHAFVIEDDRVFPTNRLGSMDGDTPDQAFVIDGDSDEESSPEPMAVEDTLTQGRAYALDMYDDAEAEDEVDALYSDDDEPEYDADEIGGDYDTRLYEQPDDDEDDSHDEDLRPHPLEPEFNDGESWAEEEDDDVLEDEEEDYEMDEEVVQYAPQPVVRSNPTVIDLISSSEDESEDEDEKDESMIDIQRSGAHSVSRASSSHPESTAESDVAHESLNDEDYEESDLVLSHMAASKEERSSEADTEGNDSLSSNVDGDGEEKREDEDNFDGKAERSDDEFDMEQFEKESLPVPEPVRNEVGQHTIPNPEYERESKSGGDIEVDAIHDLRNDKESSGTSPLVEVREHISFESRLEISEEAGAKPLTAADGLEMLSRALENESGDNNTSSTKVLSEAVVEKVILETISEKEDIANSEERDIQMQDTPDDGQETLPQEMLEVLSALGDETNQDDRMTPTRHDNAAQENTKPKSEYITPAPISPSLALSSQSRPGMNADSTFEEVSFIEAQIKDSTSKVATGTHSIRDSFEANISIEQGNEEAEAEAVPEAPVDEILQHEISIRMVEENIEYHADSASAMQDQSHGPTEEPLGVVSPANSFQSQVYDGEVTSPGIIQQNMGEYQLRNLSSPHEQSASGMKSPFASHMEIDEELQASVLENSQGPENYLLQDDENDRGTQDNDDIETTQEDIHEAIDEDEQNEVIQDDANAGSPAEESSGMHGLERERRAKVSLPPSHGQLVVEIASSPSHEQLVVEIPSSTLHEEVPVETGVSSQLIQNFTGESSPTENSDASTHDDPSLHLARVANASKRVTNSPKSPAASTEMHRPHTRSFDAHRSPTPEAEDTSVQLARASFASQPPKQDEDSYSMTAAKLQLVRHLRDELPDCTSLKVLRQHLTKSLDVIAVAMMQPPEPRRAKGGPREYMMSFTITDHSIGPYGVAEVLIYRPHIETLPVVKYGDIVLLRNFTVVSLTNKGYGLKTNDGSSWAVFDREDEPAQINGPPVEYDEKETAYVSHLRKWFSLLGDAAKEKLERANQKIINAGKAK